MIKLDARNTTGPEVPGGAHEPYETNPPALELDN